MNRLSKALVYVFVSFMPVGLLVVFIGIFMDDGLILAIGATMGIFPIFLIFCILCLALATSFIEVMGGEQ